MAFEDFADAERGGWADPARVNAYLDLFAPASDQLVQPLVGAVGARQGLEVLDLCCGHGNASAALSESGAKVTGLDLSPAMIAVARQRMPAAEFVQGDAAQLPFDDEKFDAVTCNVGFGHLPDPEAVLAEIVRVLRPGGKAALTSWREPQFSAAFQILFGAVKAHGDPGLAPPAPDFHIFSRRDTAPELLSAAGLNSPVFTDIDAAFQFDDPSGFAAVFEQATVRAAMLIRSQTPFAREAIRAAMTDQVKAGFAVGEGAWRVPFPATLVTARRS